MKQTCNVKAQIDISTYKHKKCHRYVYKKYIPFGQAIQLRRMISDDIVIDEHLKELETWFKNSLTTSKRLDQKLRNQSYHHEQN